MFRFIAILLVSLVLEAIGVVFLSRGLRQVGEVERVNAREMVRVVKAGATNPFILTGVFFEALFFAGLLILMAQADVSFIWPLTAMGFVITTLAAKLFLREEVSGLRWVGVLLIMLGVGLITWSEQRKEKPSAPPPPEAATGTGRL